MLALLVLVLPVAALVGWLVSRLSTVRGRSVAATVAVCVAIAGGVLGGPSPRVLVDLVFEGIVIAAILALTACGAGSILGWAAADDDVEPCCSRDPLVTRALPRAVADDSGVLQLPGVAHGGHGRRVRDCGWRWCFSTVIAAVFVVSVHRRPGQARHGGRPNRADDQSERLAGTPFETMPSRRLSVR